MEALRRANGGCRGSLEVPGMIKVKIKIKKRGLSINLVGADVRRL